jgi:hypothetical protein
LTLGKVGVPPAQQVKLKVPQQVAHIIREAGPEEQMRVARGEVPLAARDLLTTLLFLVHGSNPQIRMVALSTVKRLSAATLRQVLADAELHPRLLDFLARTRMTDRAVMTALASHPALPIETLRHLAGHAPPAILQILNNDEDLLTRHPEMRALLAVAVAPSVAAPALAVGDPPSQEDAESATEEDAEEASDPTEEVNLSKYQQALEMGVSEKIKMALTGDKEWRAIFLKDANKLVCSAVMKNPRITEGEVLMVAKSKTSNEELIRLITLNPDWLKNAQIQKALVVHPRTPLPKALRYMSVLTEKDLKMLAKSRGVSQVVVNTARRMLQAKMNKK